MPRPSRYDWRATEPARRPVLFVNPRSGGGRAAQAGLVERARERGIDALFGRHHDLAALVEEAVADGALTAAGCIPSSPTPRLHAPADEARRAPLVPVAAAGTAVVVLTVAAGGDVAVAFGRSGGKRLVEESSTRARVVRAAPPA